MFQRDLIGAVGPSKLVCGSVLVAEGVSACSHQDRYQNDEDYGDGGYSESFKEYCLYARKQ